jgi:triphosphatase
METELKLKIAQPDLERIYKHPLLSEHAQAAPCEHRLTDIYYDTPKLALWRHGVTLRVREERGKRDGVTWVQTVKTASAASGALHERGEWESALSSAAPQPAEIARQIKVEKIAKVLESVRLAKSLRSIFTNTTRRTIWNLALPDGQQVECALDAGNIDCDGQTITIGELELELKKGNPTQLFELGKR